MASTDALNRFTPLLLHDGITASSATPTDDTGIQFTSHNFSRIRVLCDYTSVTAANLRLFVWDSVNSTWYRIGDSDDLDPLVPGDGDEARDYFVGRGAFVHVQLEAFTGTSITIRAAGVDDGVGSA